MKYILPKPLTKDALLTFLTWRTCIGFAGLGGIDSCAKILCRECLLHAGIDHSIRIKKYHLAIEHSIEMKLITKGEALGLVLDIK